jgi:hypothetical protein
MHFPVIEKTAHICNAFLFAGDATEFNGSCNCFGVNSLIDPLLFARIIKQMKT